MSVGYSIGQGHAHDGGSTTSSGWGLTVPGSANRWLFFTTGAWDSASGGGTPTVSFAGNPMGSPILSLTNALDSSQRMLCWGLIAPPSGAGLFTITYPSSNWYAAEVAAVYTGVHQSTPYLSTAHDSGNTMGASTGAGLNGTDANGLLIGAVLQWANTVAQVVPHFGNMTKRDSGDDFTGTGGTVTTLGERVDPGSGTNIAFDWDFSGSTSNWINLTMELLPAAAGGAAPDYPPARRRQRQYYYI